MQQIGSLAAWQLQSPETPRGTTMSSGACDPLRRLNRLLREPRPPFVHGMHAENGPAERARWLDTLKALQKVQKFAAGSQIGGGVPLGDVQESVVDAVRFLVEGKELVEEEGTAKQLRVWSSPQNARLAILQEAIALAHCRRDVSLTHYDQPPLIILISERHGERTDEAQEALRRNFLDSWSSTCYGVGEVLTIQGDTSQKVHESLQTLFEGFSHSEFFPVLMVVHASPDSTITSNLTTLKRLGEPWNVRLCVEGPALAMLAQSNRPSDPEECASAADVMLLDPAAWFGFRMCALVTWHKLVKSSVLREFRDHYSKLLGSTSVMRDYDEMHGLATGPVLNLWTVLSKIGLSNVRNSADAVTVLSESLVRALRDSANVVTTYEGIGCVVRISYALSAEDRLLPKEKSRDHVLLVNNVIFASLFKESEALCVHLRVSSDGSFLLFSPVTLLSTGTFWIPPIDMVTDYAKRVQETIDKYESCRAGSVAFRSCVAKCREIKFLQGGSEQLELHLSFGAFRIVPVEMGADWYADGNEESAEIVEGLTALVAKELTESPHDVCSPQHVVQEETEKARALAEQFNRNPGRLRSTFLYKALSRRRSFPHGYGGGPLPFEVFLHSDSEKQFYDFISIEPREHCKPVHAVNQATVAADLMIACVTKVMELWRAGMLTFPPESEDVYGSDLEKMVGPDLSSNYVEDFVKGEDGVLPTHILGESMDEFGFEDPTEAPGSEVSHPTLNSTEVQSSERSQESTSDADHTNSDSSPSTATRECEYQVPFIPEPLHHAPIASTMNVPQNRAYGMKDAPSSSTIDKSSKGIGTDEEMSSPDSMPPISAKAMNPRMSTGVPKSSDLQAAIDAIPVTQAANERGRWFGSWRNRRFSTTNGESEEGSDSSSSGEESSGRSYGEPEYQESSEDEEGDDDQESESSTSDKDEDDDSSDNDSSESTNQDSVKEDDDSIDSSSSEGSDVIHEDVVRRTRASEELMPTQSGPTSRLLSWIRRPSKVQSPEVKLKQRQEVQMKQESDSENSTSDAQTDREEGETQRIGSSSEEEEISSGTGTSTFSSRRQIANNTSNDSEDESVTEEGQSTDETYEESDLEMKVESRPPTSMRNSGYGFGWFGRSGGSSKSHQPRVSRRNLRSDVELASSGTDDSESESSQSNDADEAFRKSSLKLKKRHESYSETATSESTDSSDESRRNPSLEEISDSYDSGQTNESRDTSRREHTESYKGSSSTSEDKGKKKNKTGGSFFDWVLPSWATTPPKLPRPKGSRVNSQLRIPASSGSFTDSESEEHYERKRRIRKAKKQVPSGEGTWPSSAYKSGKSRRRAR